MLRRPMFKVLLPGLALVGLGVVTLSGSPAAAGSPQAQATPTAGFKYFYFDEPIQLDLDAGRIAVFQDQGGLNAGFQGHGLEAADFSSTVVNGLSYASTPPASRSEAGIRDLVAAMAGEPAVQWSSPVFLDERGDPVIITRHLNVGFHPNVADQDAEALLATFVAGQVEARDWSNMDGVYRVLCDSRDGFDVLETANLLAQMPEVAFAEPDMFRQCYKSFIPNDPFFSQLWGLHNVGQNGGVFDMDMDAPEAWDITTGEDTVIIVILDDGIQLDHPDLHHAPGADFTGSGTNGGPLNVCDNHGTSVAGCTSAIINNNSGVVGVAPECRVASAKWNISNVPCDGSGTFNTSWFVSALAWAENSGARVTNLSASFSNSSSISTKYATTHAAGLVHFTSSGNDGSPSVGYPGTLSTVASVGAIDRDGFRSGFSNYGSALAFVAPGEEIVTTDRTGSAGYGAGAIISTQGTSYASPYAAGVAGLILSVEPTLTADEVEQIMYDTCKDRGSPGWDNQYGYGIVQAYDAVNSVQIALPNDDCGSAEWIDEGIHQFTTVGATTDGPDEGGLCTWLGYTHIESDVWFRYWAGCTGIATIDLCNAMFNTKVAIYEGCPSGPGEAIACDDDGCGLQSSVIFPVEQNTWYWVRIGGFQGEQGTGLIVVSCLPVVTCPADVNGDNVVDVVDLLSVLAAWGNLTGPEDINDDGVVDVLDLLMLLSAWGPC